MKKYRVVYAGLPDTEITLYAISVKAAALRFFSQNLLKNSIIVQEGLFKETIFHYKDMIAEVPELADADIKRVLPKKTEGKPMPIWKEFLLRLIFPSNRRF